MPRTVTPYKGFIKKSYDVKLPKGYGKSGDGGKLSESEKKMLSDAQKSSGSYGG